MRLYNELQSPLNSFYKWILGEKEKLIAKGLNIKEEVNADCPLPYVIAVFTSEHYMGQICLRQNMLMDLEVIDTDNFSLDNKKLDFYEHYEVELNSEWDTLLANFLRFITKEDD